MKKRRGRPEREYDAALAAEICELIAEGESLTDICKLERMPSTATFRKWLRARQDFAAEYARARVLQADAMDDKILRLANSTNKENAQANRVKIDALKWRAAHLNRGQYGDSVSHEVNAQIRLSAAIAASLEPVVLTPVQNGTGITGRTLEHDPVLDGEDEELLK